MEEVEALKVKLAEMEQLMSQARDREEASNSSLSEQQEQLTRQGAEIQEMLTSHQADKQQARKALIEAQRQVVLLVCLV